jgi:hypothetical protein
MMRITVLYVIPQQTFFDDAVQLLRKREGTVKVSKMYNEVISDMYRYKVVAIRTMADAHNIAGLELQGVMFHEMCLLGGNILNYIMSRIRYPNKLKLNGDA